MAEAPRRIRVLDIGPVHPRKPEESYIALHLMLSYLKGEPVESVRLTETDALRLAEQALAAVRIVRANR